MTTNPQQPPNFPHGEVAIIGACLLSEVAVTEAVAWLTPQDFYQTDNREIFKAIVSLTKKNKPIDWVFLTAELKANGTLESVGGVERLSTLADNTPSSANASHYIQQIKDKSELRRILAAGREIVAEATKDQATAKEARDLLQKLAFNSVSSDLASRRAQRIDSGLDELIRHLETAEEDDGVLTGWPDLDRITGGLHPQQLVVVGGVTGIGKSAFALDIVINALKQTAVVMFSLEMSVREIQKRMLSKKANVNLHYIRPKKLTSIEMGRIKTAASGLRGADLYVDDTGLITAAQIQARVKEIAVKIKKPIGLIAIDYLQLVISATTNQGREREVAATSRAFKAMAKDLNVPVLLLSQLSRKVDDRPDENHGHRPKKSDFRESGAIEQDADVLIGLYRPDLYLTIEKDPKNEKYKGKAEAIILKQRNGPTDTVHLVWEPSTTTYRSAVHEDTIEPPNQDRGMADLDRF